MGDCYKWLSVTCATFKNHRHTWRHWLLNYVQSFLRIDMLFRIYTTYLKTQFPVLVTQSNFKCYKNMILFNLQTAKNIDDVSVDGTWDNQKITKKTCKVMRLKIRLPGNGDFHGSVNVQFKNLGKK